MKKIFPCLTLPSSCWNATAITKSSPNSRKLGVRILLIPDGDIAAAVVTCLPNSGVDLLIGAGAGPEATIAATAMKILGGTMLVNVWRDKKDDAESLRTFKENRS